MIDRRYIKLRDYSHSLIEILFFEAVAANSILNLKKLLNSILFDIGNYLDADIKIFQREEIPQRDSILLS